MPKKKSTKKPKINRGKAWTNALTRFGAVVALPYALVEIFIKMFPEVLPWETHLIGGLILIAYIISLELRLEDALRNSND